MAKILVKQVQPQLMQTPGKEGKGFMDFFNTFRNKDKNPNVGVKQRLAGLAGMAGKGLAGLATAQSTFEGMQGGNLSAPLSAGYTYESLDPTGRMISEAANPNPPNPQPRLSIEEQRGNVNQIALPEQNTTSPPAAPAMPPMPPSLSQPVAPIPPLPTPTTPQIAAPTPAAPQPAAPQPAAPPMPTLGGGHPTTFTGQPTGYTPLPPPPPSAYGIPVPQPQQPQQPQTQTQTQTQTPEQIAQANQLLLPTEQMNQQPVSPNFFQQNQNNVEPAPAPFDINNINPVTGMPWIDAKKSFVTALTEKLGADMVYKMTPHQMGSFAAYTLLKLR